MQYIVADNHLDVSLLGLRLSKLSLYFLLVQIFWSHKIHHALQS